MSPNRFFTPSSLEWCSLRYKANGTYPIIQELFGIFNSNNKKIYAKLYEFKIKLENEYL